jgi:hypothetical protein
MSLTTHRHGVICSPETLAFHLVSSISIIFETNYHIALSDAIEIYSESFPSLSKMKTEWRGSVCPTASIITDTTRGLYSHMMFGPIIYVVHGTITFFHISSPAF